MSNSSSFSKAFLGAAVSTAASPLRNGFVDLDCRSPVTPRRPSHHRPGLYVDTERSRYESYDQGPYLPPPRNVPMIQSPSEYIYSAGIRTAGSEISSGARSCVTLISPGVESRFLPRTPQLLFPSTNGLYVDPDAGKLGTFSAINIILGKTVGVGIYSVPSSIFIGVGSVGMSILMWVLGSIISFCGLAVYLDLGTAMPRSGGEKIYLERIFRRPHMLASCMFMAYVVLLGFSTPNCIVLGEYVMYTLGIEVNRWNVRTIAVVIITLVCVIHARYQKVGLRIINVLGVGKMMILVIVILAGVAGMIMGVGVGHLQLVDRRLGGHYANEVHMPAYMLTTAQRNFSNIWAGSSTQPYDYATALLKVLYCFRGYSTANQVLSEVRNPVKTLKIAAPAALCLVSASYILANIAYFMAVEQEDFRSSGVVVAGHFFKNVFGELFGERILPCFIIISAFGNIAATSFAQARVNQELGKDGLLPFSDFFSSTSEWNTPARGLLLHWLVSVLVIVVPPPGEIYNFLVDIGGYPVSVISVSISLGLLYLQTTPAENWSSPFRARKVYTIVFFLSNCFLLVFPWIEPQQGKGRFPYYAYPTTALAILGSGVLYWVWWAKIKPTIRGKGPWMKRHRTNSSDGDEIFMWRLPKYFENSRQALPREQENLYEEHREEQEEAGIRKRAPCGCPARH